jgi:hypothetical protein
MSLAAAFCVVQNAAHVSAQWSKVGLAVSHSGALPAGRPHTRSSMQTSANGRGFDVHYARRLELQCTLKQSRRTTSLVSIRILLKYKDTCIGPQCLENKHGCPRRLMCGLLLMDRVPIIGRYLPACTSAGERCSDWLAFVCWLIPCKWSGIRRAFRNQQSESVHSQSTCGQRMRAGGPKGTNTIGGRTCRRTPESLTDKL